MSFWAFCCKFPQVYRSQYSAAQYPNHGERSPAGVPPLDGNGGPAVDNEGDWKSLSDFAGVKNDGTLWCWFPALVNVWNFKNGSPVPADAPVKISEDTDWASVTTGNVHGMALKEDGSLWAFGQNSGGCLGIGLSTATFPDYYYTGFQSGFHSNRHYRAILSCSVKSIENISGSQFTSKPTATINSVDPSIVGTGAVLEVDWTAEASGFYLTSAGSGYTSTPTIRMVGTSAEDAGKSITGTCTLNPSAVGSFRVVKGGTGYTYATARERWTGATATAVINEGVIESWDMTSAGTSLVSMSAEANGYLLVSIDGDGDGAAAEVATLPRTVNYYITFPSQKIWTSLPRVEFTGGGGAGAAVRIDYFMGAVDAIRVVNGGTGYTQGNPQNFGNRLRCELSNAAGEYVANGGTVTLNPGPVTSVICNGGIPTSTYDRGSFNNPNLRLISRSRTGTQKPFSTSTQGLGYSAYAPSQTFGGLTVHSSFLVSSDGTNTPLAVTLANQYNIQLSLTQSVSGLNYPPFIKTYFKVNGPDTYTANSTTERRFYYQISDWCSYYYGGGSSYGTWAIYTLPGGVPSGYPASGPWPIADASVDLSFEGGGSASYTNVDGQLLPTSVSPGSLASYTGDYFGLGNHLASLGPADTVAKTVSIYKEPISCLIQNVAFTVGGWFPPSIEEVNRIYFAPSTYGGESLYAEATPSGGDGVSYGFGTNPVIKKSGALYDEEPPHIVYSDFFEYPVRVGSDTWASASATDIPLPSTSWSGQTDYYAATLGVKQDGSLWWWGGATANGRDLECPSPSPVGQGVAFTFKPSGDSETLKALGLSSVTPGERFDVGTPQHGVYHANPPTSTRAGYRYDRDAKYGFADGTLYGLSYYGFSFGYFWTGDSIFASSSNLTAPEYLPLDENLYERSQPARTGRGLGYTSTPTCEILAAGDKVASATTRLIGQTSFSKVQSYYAMSSDGQWFAMNDIGTSVVRGTLPVYKYEGTYEQRQTTSVGDLQYPKVAYTRTSKGVQVPFRSFVSHSGSGYTTATISATASLPYLPGNFTPESKVLSKDSVMCERMNYNTGDKYESEVIKSSVTSLTVDPQIKGFTTGYSLPLTTDGRVKPNGVLSYSSGILRDSWGCVDGAASCSLSGDGSGAAVDTKFFAEPYESQFVPVTPPSMETGFSGQSTGDGFTACIDQDGSTSLASSEYLYHDSGLQSGYTEMSGKYWRRAGDESVWNVTLDSTSFNRQAAHSEFRVFPLSLSVDSTGSGYGDPAAATVTQQPGVATASVIFDGKVSAIGIMNQGSGYASPPTVSMTATGGGNAGTATAVIAGPVESVSVTAPGSGYLLPPRVLFAGQGRSPSATCSLNANGGVAAVQVSDGGRYRNTPPTVSFEPIVQIDALAMTSGGDEYTVAPPVFIGGGGGDGATAKCRLRAKVIEIVMTSQGSGYTRVPDVLIDGGAGSGATAIAGISFDDKVVTGITLQNRGDFYQTPPTVTIVGGGGTGATAYAKISGYIDEITLLNRGADFVVPPTIVFCNTDDGAGAAASATLRGFGTGAAATARIDGSVIYCTHSGSSGLQSEPTVSIADTGNFRIDELWQKVVSGSMTTDEFSEQRKQFAARAKSRIEGKVTGITITSPGSGYSTTQQGVPSAVNKKFESIAFISAQFAEYQSRKDPQDFNRSGRYALPCSVNGSSIASATMNASIGSLTFWKKPSVTFIDGLSAIPKTCLTMTSAAVRKALASPDQVYSYDTFGVWDGTTVGGVRPARLDVLGNFSTRTWNEFYSGAEAARSNASIVTCIAGKISAIENIESFGLAFGAFGADVWKSLHFDPKPTVTVEDEAGSGAVVSIPSYAYGFFIYRSYSGVSTSRFTVESQGSGYTLSSRIVIRGGQPLCWKEDSKASATAVISEGGKVLSVTMNNVGKGYTQSPEVIFYGGGGTGAKGIATAEFYSDGRISRITITDPGTGYTSAPKIAIVDKDKPFDRSSSGKGIQAVLDEYYYPTLKNYSTEYCFVVNQWQMTLDSPVRIIADRNYAEIVPFFEDDGYIEGVSWVTTDPRQFGSRPIDSAPTVAPAGQCESPATFDVDLVKWSNVMSSGGNLKTSGTQ
jgi:hypothetical protein